MHSRPSGPDAYRNWRESLAKDLGVVTALVHPLVKKDPYYAPMARRHFQLSLEEIERLNNENQVGLHFATEIIFKYLNIWII